MMIAAFSRLFTGGRIGRSAASDGGTIHFDPERGPVGRLIRPVTETLPGRSVALAGTEGGGDPGKVSIAGGEGWPEARNTPQQSRAVPGCSPQ